MNFDHYDHIDQAISKTYFNATEKKSKTSTKNPVKKTIKTNNTLFKITLTAVFIASISIGTLLLIRHFMPGRKIIFTVVEVDDAKSGTGNGPIFSLDRFTKKAKPLIDDSTDILFDFEKDANGWEIPSWAFDKPDHIARSLDQISGISSNGTGSLKCDVKFLSERWSASHIEIAQYLDLGNYDNISADIYLPPAAPRGLKAQFILTVGEDWRFVEMSKNSPLTPGEWTTITSNISEKSKDWRRTVVDMDFKTDIRKLAIRVESNGRSTYSGPIYFDAVRVSKTHK